jgi:hypothetical protein
MKNLKLIMFVSILISLLSCVDSGKKTNKLTDSTDLTDNKTNYDDNALENSIDVNFSSFLVDGETSKTIYSGNNVTFTWSIRDVKYSIAYYQVDKSICGLQAGVKYQWGITPKTASAHTEYFSLDCDQSLTYTYTISAQDRNRVKNRSVYVSVVPDDGSTSTDQYTDTNTESSTNTDTETATDTNTETDSNTNTDSDTNTDTTPSPGQAFYSISSTGYVNQVITKTYDIEIRGGNPQITETDTGDQAAASCVQYEGSNGLACGAGLINQLVDIGLSVEQYSSGNTSYSYIPSHIEHNGPYMVFASNLNLKTIAMHWCSETGLRSYCDLTIEKKGQFFEGSLSCTGVLDLTPLTGYGPPMGGDDYCDYHQTFFDSKKSDITLTFKFLDLTLYEND